MFLLDVIGAIVVDIALLIVAVLIFFIELLYCYLFMLFSSSQVFIRNVLKPD